MCEAKNFIYTIYNYALIWKRELLQPTYTYEFQPAQGPDQNLCPNTHE